eukprot:9412113-Pyramimonas_sp.AAC.1
MAVMFNSVEINSDQTQPTNPSATIHPLARIGPQEGWFQRFRASLVTTPAARITSSATLCPSVDER